MADRHTPEQRSYNMSQVKGSNTKPELFLFSELERRKIAYIAHPTGVYGKPDAILRDYKIALFVDGEFWHGRNLEMDQPKLTDFWINKIQTNISRDKKVNKKLRSEGWRIIRIWDKDLIKNPTNALARVRRGARLSAKNESADSAL